ncbi:LysR family transcriptional regulator [Hyphomonas sp. ND6WE1B]|uniref:LysR family transcriptional regulator n=1 Tax=Hyphomonas sp. ND6WE1B TaxID=1848191 RepID=UPI0008076A03|nr:LysR family transcriptional regulator [Hyphomonas sp. ND6WE1B]
MDREQFADLAAFMVVAEEQSFTRAAARMGMSQSAVSQIVRRLEANLGLRLLSRTTRSVAPTEVGERLLNTLSPMLHELDASVAELGEFRDKPAGTLRLTTVEHAAKMYILPALAKLLPDNPDIIVEVIIDYGLTDVVANRFDAGVRLGEAVEKDMIAVRISPEIPMSIVATSGYLEAQGIPEHPRQLIGQRCINLRLPTSSSLNEWRFSKKGRELRVRVEGPLVFNTLDLIRDATLAGLGLAYLPTDQVEEHLATGALVEVLADWASPLPGYHLFYPNRRYLSPAFKLLVDTVRHR